MVKHKLSIEFIRAEFKKEGYELLTEVYKNSKQKLEYICPRGRRHYITWDSWKQGKRCPCCASNAKLTIEFVRSEFEKEGYTLLTIVYENAHKKLDYICPRGCRNSITWNNWQRGERCPCFSKYRNRPTVDSIRTEFAKEGYKLLTEVYEGAHQKLEYICPSGHRHSVNWSNWGQGKRCPCVSNQMSPTIEFICAEFAKKGYTLLTEEYKNNRQKLDYICPKGHRHFISWYHWQRGQRCPFCSNSVSKWEKEVKKFFDELNIDYVPNDRTQLLNPETGRFLELDIWFPDLNKAIECNGTYWHSQKQVGIKDKIKFALCKEKNISLLVLSDEKWAKDKIACQREIKNFIINKEAVQSE